jgi:hypothetical protein
VITILLKVPQSPCSHSSIVISAWSGVRHVPSTNASANALVEIRAPETSIAARPSLEKIMDHSPRKLST